jgi:hypothetical protein
MGQNCSNRPVTMPFQRRLHSIVRENQIFRGAPTEGWSRRAFLIVPRIILQYIAAHLQEVLEGNMTTKTATLAFRIDPGLKDTLRTAVRKEHHSIANMEQVLIRDDCEKHGIAISYSGAGKSSGEHSA